MKIEPKDCKWEDTIDLGDGRSIKLEYPYDTDHEEPWNDGDCRGIVSEWTRREKRPGERILITDGYSRRYFNIEATMKEARTTWGFTDREQAAKAVEWEFQHLRRWCQNLWSYIGVCVTLLDAEGKEISSESVWGFESEGDDYAEEAASFANDLIEAHDKELAESAYWAEREVMTV